jgi:hypothetical protein
MQQLRMRAGRPVRRPGKSRGKLVPITELLKLSMK